MNKLSSAMMCALCCAVVGFGCGKDAGRNVGEIKEAKIKAEDLKVVKVADGVEFNMVRVEPGSFTMNMRDGENFANEVEHVKKINKVFYIGQTEVTQKQYKTVVDMWKAKFPEKYAKLYPEVWNAELGKDKFGEYIKPANFFFSKDGKGKDRIKDLNLENYPVENISWVDAMDFCVMLNELGMAPKGYKFTLPTESQWEFAARGGNAGKDNKHKYSGSNNVDNVAWYNETASGRTGRAKEVGVLNSEDKRSCNELGLYDMSGNVAEWCLDGWVRESDKTKAELDIIDEWAGQSLRYRALIYKEIESKLAFDNKRDIRKELKLTAEEKEALDDFKCKWRSYRGGAWSGSDNVCRINNRGAFSPYELNKDVKANEKDKSAKNDIIYSVVGYPHVGMRLVLVPAE